MQKQHYWQVRRTLGGNLSNGSSSPHPCESMSSSIRAYWFRLRFQGILGIGWDIFSTHCRTLTTICRLLAPRRCFSTLSTVWPNSWSSSSILKQRSDQRGREVALRDTVLDGRRPFDSRYSLASSWAPSCARNYVPPSPLLPQPSFHFMISFATIQLSGSGEGVANGSAAGAMEPE